MSSALFLEAAARIAKRICDSASWSSDRCTWMGVAPKGNGREIEQRPSGGTVYHGAAGTSLFLADLFSKTRERRVARTAVGGLSHALDWASELPPNQCGLYVGRVGIGYAAVRVGERVDRPDLVRRGVELLRGVEGHEFQDLRFDVVSGAAGAIPALLWTAERLGDERLLRSAGRLGDHLLRCASVEPTGWSWGAMNGLAIRNLVGLGHGAAGCGWALLELYRATGAGEYRYGAEQAFLYEQQFAQPGSGFYPDFRHPELASDLLMGDAEVVRARLRAGQPVGKEHSGWMSAWCHGAPGIALSRFRAYEILGDPLHLGQGRAALEPARRSIRNRELNFSLCHGVAGNCEPLLRGAPLLGDGLREEVEQVALEGWERYGKDGARFPCGTPLQQPDSSLLVGEAGIGHFYLRLSDLDIPSVLLIPSSGGGVHTPARHPADGYERCRVSHVRTYFGDTLDRLQALGVAAEPVLSGEDSEVQRTFAGLAARIASEPDPGRRLLLDDAFRVDRLRFQATRTLSDFTEELVRGLGNPELDEIRWDEDRFSLHPETRVVRTEWRWAEWLRMPSGNRSSRPAAGVGFTLLYRRANRIRIHRLSAFAAYVLASLGSPRTLGEVVRDVAEQLASEENSARHAIENAVRAQLHEALALGILATNTRPRPAPDPRVRPAPDGSEVEAGNPLTYPMA